MAEVSLSYIGAMKNSPTVETNRRDSQTTVDCGCGADVQDDAVKFMIPDFGVLGLNSKNSWTWDISASNVVLIVSAGVVTTLWFWPHFARKRGLAMHSDRTFTVLEVTPFKYKSIDKRQWYDKFPLIRPTRCYLAGMWSSIVFSKNGYFCWTLAPWPPWSQCKVAFFCFGAKIEN